MPGIELHGKTDVGQSRRNNEDAFAILPELSLAIVCDGMGGAACGEVASELTVETIIDQVRAANDGQPEEAVLRQAIETANARVRSMSKDRAECSGMGSTVVLALCRGERVWIANVGDSRAYLWRAGELRQLSYDQNLANELRLNLGLTEEQVRGYPHRHVLTMAIGTSDEVTVRMEQETLEEGDVLLLCSDGLSGPVGEVRIQEILAAGRPLTETVDTLVEEANLAGGPDNITAVLLRYA
jgi:PPM family protein phosphatase